MLRLMDSITTVTQRHPSGKLNVCRRVNAGAGTVASGNGAVLQVGRNQGSVIHTRAITMFHCFGSATGRDA
jgi:hypothetical protein